MVVGGTEEAVEAAGPPVLNLEIVVVHVVHSAAAGGWDDFLLAVRDTFLVKIVYSLLSISATRATTQWLKPLIFFAVPYKITTVSSRNGGYHTVPLYLALAVNSTEFKLLDSSNQEW